MPSLCFHPFQTERFLCAEKMHKTGNYCLLHPKTLAIVHLKLLIYHGSQASLHHSCMLKAVSAKIEVRLASPRLLDKLMFDIIINALKDILSQKHI